MTRFRMVRTACRSVAVAGFAALGMSLSASTTDAAVTTFGNSSAFSASLPAGNYVNTTWNGLNGFASGTQSFSGGTPTTAYTARNNSGESFYVDTFFTPPVLSTANGGASSVITFDFTGSNAVYSVGGGFVVTDVNGIRLAGPTLGLTFWSGTNGTGTQLASATVVSSTGTLSAALPFFGLTSTDPIASLVVTPSTAFTGINNFITAVPEPPAAATTALALAAMAGATATRRKRPE